MIEDVKSSLSDSILAQNEELSHISSSLDKVIQNMVDIALQDIEKEKRDYRGVLHRAINVLREDAKKDAELAKLAPPNFASYHSLDKKKVEHCIRLLEHLMKEYK